MSVEHEETQTSSINSLKDGSFHSVLYQDSKNIHFISLTTDPAVVLEARTIQVPAVLIWAAGTRVEREQIGNDRVREYIIFKEVILDDGI